MSTDDFTCSTCGSKLGTRGAAMAHLKASPGHAVRGLFHNAAGAYERSTVFLAAMLPTGQLTGVGRLPCPHCGDLHLNPEDGSNQWTLSQVRALVAMQASLVCAGCGQPSTVKER